MPSKDSKAAENKHSEPVKQINDAKKNEPMKDTHVDDSYRAPKPVEKAFKKTEKKSKSAADAIQSVRRLIESMGSEPPVEHKEKAEKKPEEKHEQTEQK